MLESLFPDRGFRGFTLPGDFYGDDTHESKPIKAHFIWSDITATSARWEQEFSADGGRTWESNWVMEFTRA